MKILVEYDPNTGEIKGKNELSAFMVGMEGFEQEECVSASSAEVVELVKLGLSSDEIIKLRHNGLL